jgi:leucyl/phenylalanyl-tRNA--protein transferase
MKQPNTQLAWLDADTPFPPPDQAWGSHSQAPGLLAAGGDLSMPRLLSAYQQGIFPWYSNSQPILWFSTDPRMVLHPAEFKLHRSLEKTLKKFIKNPDCQLEFNRHFETVIRACAETTRTGQTGTWITEDMIRAYMQLHQAGYAHSVEVIIGGKLLAGLYLVSIGQMVYGESMFTTISNGSKIALAGLVAWCRAHQLPLIDCQQQTAHLASLGARPISRQDFSQQISQLTKLPALKWEYSPVYWKFVLANMESN